MTTAARRPFPGRQVLVLLGLLFLAVGVFGSLALVMPNISPACGCASPASAGPPTPTPPVSLSRAATSAARFTGVDMTALDGWFDMGGRPVAETVGPNAYAIVDGTSGEVLVAAMRVDRPLGSPAVSLFEAKNAAIAYLDSVGISAGPLTAIPATLESVPAVVEVVFSEGTAKPAYRVYVDAVSGRVIGFSVGRLDYASVPVLSKARAVELARRALPEAPDVVLGADLTLTIDDRPNWTWQIGLGIPLPSDVYTGGGYVEVDASTGTATVLKDARDATVR